VTGNPDALVVGAGIVGAACAMELAANGVSVSVVDQGVPGGGTTAAAMGHLVVMDDSEAQGDLTRWSQELWQQLAPSLPGIEHDPCGTLWVAADEAELEAAGRKADWCRDRDVDAEVIDARALRELEPHLSGDLVGALRVPGDSVVYPPTATEAMLDRARDNGATVTTGFTARSVDPRGATSTDGRRLDADVVICAAGHHTLKLLHRPVPGAVVRGRKGHLAITARRPGLLRHQVVELGYLKSAHGHDDVSVACNLQPRTSGQVLIGSSRQYDRESAEVEPPVLARMLARARRFLPALGGCPVVRCWTGFRPATPDNLPLVGRAQEGEDLWLATGHEGLGITTALGTARIIADGVLGRPSSIDPTPYLPRRFAGSDHG